MTRLLKTLFIGLLAVFSFINFSSAGSYELIYEGKTTPNGPFSCYFYLSGLTTAGDTFKVSLIPNLSEGEQIWYVRLGASNSSPYQIYDGLDLVFEDVPSFNKGYVAYSLYNDHISDCPYISLYRYDPNFNLRAEGLEPVITGFTNSISEFIPYIVFISLGVLGGIIGFVAIKWLVSRLFKGILSIFKK